VPETPRPPAPAPPAGRFQGVLDQVGGIAAWGLLIGLAAVLVPLVLHRPLYVLPIAGLLAGVQAIRRGQLVGGIIALVLNVLGGLFTLVALFG
jgi:hypothetical protein